MSLQNKLLQYSVEILVTPGNNSVLEPPSKAVVSPASHMNAVNKAKRAYERKNKRVQELFLNRPDLLQR